MRLLFITNICSISNFHIECSIVTFLFFLVSHPHSLFDFMAKRWKLFIRLTNTDFFLLLVLQFIDVHLCSWLARFKSFIPKNLNWLVCAFFALRLFSRLNRIGKSTKKLHLIYLFHLFLSLYGQVCSTLQSIFSIYTPHTE